MNDDQEKAAAGSDVASALSNAWDYNDPKTDPVSTMAIGNFVFFENTQQLESQEPRVYLQEGITLVNRRISQDPDEADNDLYTYTFGYETRSFTGANPVQSTRQQERTASVPRSTASTHLQGFARAQEELPNLIPFEQSASGDLRLKSEDYVMQLGYEKLIALPYYCVSSAELEKACQEQLGAETCTRSCSGLSTYSEIVDPPALIKAQPNCGGMPGCKMTVHHVKFASSFSVKKNGTTQTQKVIYSIALSPELPFLARMTEFCQKGLFAYNSSKILVNSCTVLRNYEAAP